MKSLSVFILCCLIALPSIAFGADRIKQVDRPEGLPSFLGYKPNEFIVVMKTEAGVLMPDLARGDIPRVGDADFDAISERFAVSRIRQQFAGAEPGPNSRSAELARYHKVRIEDGRLEDAMLAYASHPLVDRVEPIGIHAMYATPNDGYYDPYQWYHNQASDHDIDSPEAWNIQTGSTNIIVADLDSGTRYYHPDLGGANASPSNPGASRGNIWINDAELNGSAGVDDDGNGYVDDWIGYDFIDGVSNCWPGEDCNSADNDPRDFNGHGTHTAGIVGMLTNDGYGMAGTAGGWGNGSQAVEGNGVKVMVLRMGYSYNYFGQEYGVVMMDAAAEAFYYAANNGARIATCSWGSSNSGGIGAAATYFLNNGGLIFVAAGNDGSQTADYLNGRGDCISVAATDENDAAASFTTYGTWVDICAPGVNIYATYHDHMDPNTNYWASLGGTSMATPMAAAVGALIWSQNPGWTASQVENQLYASADNIDAYLGGQYIGKMGAGRINSYNAVNTGPPPAPVAGFSGSPTSGTEPLNVSFTDLSTGSVDTWSWTFGDGGNSSTQNPNHSYTSAGIYTVSLTVTGPGGSDTETKTGYITVDPCVAPVAGFVGAPLSGDYPLTVDFTDQSSGADSYSWDFGDGSGTSTQANPSYTYTTAGVYTVTQTVSNACGSDQLVRTDYITVTTPPPPPPTAEFSGSPTSGDFPLTVAFTDLSTDAPTSWSWDFGDGAGGSSLQNPSYTYTAAGTYTVSLTATNAYGSDTETKVDYITVTEPSTGGTLYAEADLPVSGSVTGTYLDTQASDNVRQTLQEESTGGKPNTRVTFLEHKWIFTVPASTALTFYVEGYRDDNVDGDDFTFAYSTDNTVFTDMLTVASATEQVYSSTIPSDVSGTVYVRVTDTDRTTGNRSKESIHVDHMYIEYSAGPVPPIANFSGAPGSGNVPLTVDFTDLSTGNPSSWSWDFGDGAGASTAQNPTYTYTAVGTYTVSLTAANAYGSDTETKVDYITVTEPPVGTDMYVFDIVVTRIGGGAKQGQALVTIHDGNSQPVSGATVTGDFTGVIPETGATGVTDANGQATIVTAGSAQGGGGDVCFEVTDVAHATYTYNAALNNVTESCQKAGDVYGEGSDPMLLAEGNFALGQNHPNPFNPKTTIEFTLTEATSVELTVFDIHGRKIVTLADGHFGAGVHRVQWNAEGLASGTYLYRIQAGEETVTKRMILLK